MNSNTLKAKEILNEGAYTLVFCDGQNIITSEKRGVKPLLDLLDSEKDYSRYCAADKVVGRAAAYLYVLLGVNEVCALTMSEGARTVFEKYGIIYFYDTLTQNIINRKGDGLCPMEEATKDATEPRDALWKIRAKLKELNS